MHEAIRRPELRQWVAAIPEWDQCDAAVRRFGVADNESDSDARSYRHGTGPHPMYSHSRPSCVSSYGRAISLHRADTMPKPFKPTRPFRLPAGAEVVAHGGKPHVRLKERGKPVLYPLTKDGAKYLRPAKRWYFDLRDADGTVQRVKGFADLKATEQLAAELERKVAGAPLASSIPPRSMLSDRSPIICATTPPTSRSKGNTLEHVTLTAGRGRACSPVAGRVLEDVDTARAAEWLNGLRRDDAPARTARRRRRVPPVRGCGAARRVTMCGPGDRRPAAPTRRGRHGKARHAPTGDGAGAGRPRRRWHRAGDGEPLRPGRPRGFFRWMVRPKRVGSNPLESLSPGQRGRGRAAGAAGN